MVIVEFVTNSLVTVNKVANKFVVVAFVVVALMKSAFAKCEVEEAKSPACAQSAVVVAAVFTP